MLTDRGLMFCEGQVIAIADAGDPPNFHPSTNIIDLSAANAAGLTKADSDPDSLLIATSQSNMFFNVMFNSATVESGQWRSDLQNPLAGFG